MEMERCKNRAGEEVLGAVALVLDLAKAFGRVSLPGGLVLGDALQLPKDDLGGALWVFLSTRGACSLKDVWRSRSRPSRLSCQGPSGVACFYGLCCSMHRVKLHRFIRS